MVTPKYPIYVPSKGRADCCLTARDFLKYKVPFRLVVEPQEVKIYAARFPDTEILVLPKNGQGLIYARNWIFERSVKAGDERHWQIDDNIRAFMRRYQGIRMYCDSNIALRTVEDFTDRYTNIGLSGMNYAMFVKDHIPYPPFILNAHVYSNTLINNAIPFRYRPPANEDVDICLQVLAGGWCIVQVNAFLAHKIATMRMHGGQTDAAYQGDGRLFMARALERAWPGVVTTRRRFHRAQHVVIDNWKRFDTPLIKKPGLENLPAIDEYGMELAEMQPVKSSELRAIQQQYAEGQPPVEKPARKRGKHGQR